MIVTSRKLFFAASMIALLVSFFIALLPEPPAELLTSEKEWKPVSTPSSKIRLSDFPEQFRQLRHSVIEAPGAVLFRTWTPDEGVVSLAVTSAPFRPSRYMSVVITGKNRTSAGRVQAFLECEINDQKLDIFRGSVNVNAAEAIVVAPPQWCPGNAKLKFRSTESQVNVGVGSVFKISWLSYLKSTFFGQLPYLISALLIFALLMFAGASIATRVDHKVDPLPAALASLGGVGICMFYFESIIPISLRWVGTPILLLVAVCALLIVGTQARSRAAIALKPFAKMWVFAGLAYFAILGLAINNVGHWEPNYRFWPATWSSDNELPWLLAEAIRRGWDLKTLFGGGWLPTDRPPLMAGAYLPLTDAFQLLQSSNDGMYLRGRAFNAAAVTLNTLWVPTCWWLLGRLRQNLDHRCRALILVFMGCLPFVLFNTIYGWPKLFGAAFALAAFGMAWQAREGSTYKVQRSGIIGFFVLAALSMLAHASSALFLAPLALLCTVWTVRTAPRSILVGLGIASALLGSWSLYKALILPSSDPVIKFALTGDFGFGNPAQSIFGKILARYEELNLLQWLQIKKIMFLQSFLPLHHAIYQIHLNTDFGAGVIDKLRAWDFEMLSKGNLAVPFLVVAAVWGAFTNGARDPMRASSKYIPFLTLIAISLVVWLLMVISFFAPIIIHHWPQAALFGLALPSAAIVQDRYPRLFLLTLFAVAMYTGIVWLLSPLHVALDLDLGAAAVILILCLYSVASQAQLFLPSKDHGSISGAVSLRRTIRALAEDHTLRRALNWAGSSIVLRILTVTAFLFAAYFTFRYINQPLADAYAFRQTQTALTSYWMLKDGWAFAYQTPVVGFPWSIPFEFPIYQSLVAVMVAMFGFDLEPTGRFLSFAFLAACAWPAFAVGRRLHLPAPVPWVFCALLWTSPLNVYYGRTFMIETAALFLAFGSIPFAIDVIRGEGGRRSLSLFVFFASAALLQKATTGGPVLLLLALAAFAFHLRQGGISLRVLRRLTVLLGLFAIPLVVGLAWAHYTDIVKTENAFGVQLTSGALSTWNFGTIAQRLSLDDWNLLIWKRSFLENGGGYLGALLLILPWFGPQKYRRFAEWSLVSLALFILPMLIFTNVHIIHDYYQVASVPFLIAALSIVTGGWLDKVSGTKLLAPIVTLLLMLSNIVAFASAFGLVAARTLPELHPLSVEAYKVGQYLRKHTPEGSGIVVFGQGYSSEIAFHARRKAMTADPRFTQYQRVWEDPRAYLGGLEVGAIVVCPSKNGFPGQADVREKLSREHHWRRVQVMRCEILLPTTSP